MDAIPPSTGVALFDCIADDPIDELTFNKGDIFVDVQPAPLEKGWYEATLKRTGKRGLVPSNYVRLETIPPDGPATSGTMPRKKAPPPPPPRKPSTQEREVSDRPATTISRRGAAPPPPPRKSSLSATASQITTKDAVDRPTHQKGESIDDERTPEQPFGVKLRASGRLHALLAQDTANTAEDSSEADRTSTSDTTTHPLSEASKNVQSVPIRRATTMHNKPPPPPLPQRKRINNTPSLDSNHVAKSTSLTVAEKPFQGVARLSQTSEMSNSRTLTAPTKSSSQPTPPPPPPKPVSLIPGIPNDAVRRYRSVFQMWDRDGDGYLEGYEIRTLWRRSRLPRQELRAIWALADADADGRLNAREFCIGMWLIDERLDGRPVPPVLPPQLRC